LSQNLNKTGKHQFWLNSLAFSIIYIILVKNANYDNLITVISLRPCERRNFPNFSFSQVSELFRFWSSEIFRKNLFFPNLQKFCKKSSEISSGQKTLFLRQKQGFANILNLWNIQNLLFSKFSKNYQKMTSKLNFYICEKLVPTQIPTRIFELEFGMQGPIFHIFISMFNIMLFIHFKSLKFSM